MRHAKSSELRRYRTAVRRWRGFQVPDGIARRRRARPEEFNRDQLAIGTTVEMEHTRYPEIAMEIAMAHLLERPDYYELLERMERVPRRRDRSHAPRSRS